LNHEELSKVYASSDVFVFPSISETFGNVVVEAMASGCVPVIARGGGSQSLVMDGVTGFLCDPYNVSEYVENIKKVLHSSTIKEIIQQNAIHYASTFNWDRLTNEYFNDLQTLAVSFPIYKNDVLKPNEIMPTNYAI
jgi:glycosyltransferase involved in cell wall biosynthesis